jgi:hypothetical protein
LAALVGSPVVAYAVGCGEGVTGVELKIARKQEKKILLKK